MFTTVEKAIEELKKGKAIIVVDDEDRENEGDFVALGEFATPEMINFMATEGRGLICVPIEEEKAKQLDLKLMTENNSDALRHCISQLVLTMQTVIQEFLHLNGLKQY